MHMVYHTLVCYENDEVDWENVKESVAVTNQGTHKYMQDNHVVILCSSDNSQRIHGGRAYYSN